MTERRAGPDDAVGDGGDGGDRRPGVESGDNGDGERVEGDDGDGEQANDGDGAWRPVAEHHDEAVVSAVRRKRRAHRVLGIASWLLPGAGLVGGVVALDSIAVGLVFAGGVVLVLGHDFVYGTDLVTLATDASPAAVERELRSAENPFVLQSVTAADGEISEHTEAGTPVVRLGSGPDQSSAHAVVAFEPDGLDHSLYDADGRPLRTHRVEVQERPGRTEVLVRVSTHEPLSVEQLVRGVLAWRYDVAAYRAAGYEVVDSDTSLSLSPPTVTPAPHPDEGRATTDAG